MRNKQCIFALQLYSLRFFGFIPELELSFLFEMARIMGNKSHAEGSSLIVVAVITVENLVQIQSIGKSMLIQPFKCINIVLSIICITVFWFIYMTQNRNFNLSFSVGRTNSNIFRKNYYIRNWRSQYFQDVSRDSEAMQEDSTQLHKAQIVTITNNVH